MKKIYLILFIFLLSSCLSNTDKNQSMNLDFSDELNFDELKKNLILYGEISSYPELNE